MKDIKTWEKSQEYDLKKNTKMEKTRCKQTNFTVAAIGSQLQVADEVIFHIKYQKISNVCVFFFFFKKETDVSSV